MWDTAKSSSDMAELAGCKLPAEADGACKGVIIYNAPYSKHRYSSVWANHKVGHGYARGRLDSGDSFIPANPPRLDVDFLQIDSGERQSIAGVVIQGRSCCNQFLRTVDTRARLHAVIPMHPR